MNAIHLSSLNSYKNFLLASFLTRISQSSFVNYYATVHMGVCRKESMEGRFFLGAHLEKP